MQKNIGSVIDDSQVNLKIVSIEEKDIVDIYELYKEFAAYEKLEDYFSASLEELKKLLFEDKLLYILKAEWAGKIVGFAAYYYQLVTFPAKKVLYLEDIFVREAHRGMGIGNLFFEELEKIARENDCLKMTWKCLGWNKTSRLFYEHMGAKLDEEWVIYDKML